MHCTCDKNIEKKFGLDEKPRIRTYCGIFIYRFLVLVLLYFGFEPLMLPKTDKAIQPQLSGAEHRSKKQKRNE